jgi:SAM-dependent methyltransferase
VLSLLSTAEEVPVRTGSLDLVTTFNSVHHFDLERFLAVAGRVLKPNGQLFIYTRTPEQNARTIWGRYFPGFAKREQRLHSEVALREAVRRTRTQAGRHPDLPPSPVEHAGTAQGPGRGPPLLDLLTVFTRRAARGHRHLPGPPRRPRGDLGRRAPSGRRRPRLAGPAEAVDDRDDHRRSPGSSEGTHHHIARVGTTV